MKLELDTIKRVGEYCKKKPREYHHACTGNGNYPHSQIMLDLWTPVQAIECCRAGQTNLMTPDCETCDGQHVEDVLLLKDSEKAFNRGIDRLIAVLEDC